MSSTTTYDFARYQWRRSPEDPSFYSRPAGGGELVEDIYNRFNHNEQNLFLGVTLNLLVPTPTESFVTHARDAWIATRHIVPIVAAHTEHTAEGGTLITYRVPKNDEEALEWANKTIILESSTTNLDELRFEIGKEPIPAKNGDQTFVYVVPVSETSYGLLLYTSHIPFDGAGTKAVMSLFLTKLAEYIDDATLAKKENAVWGPEAERLLPYVTEVLADTEPRGGPAYDSTLASVMGDLAHTTPRMWGFKVRNIGPGPTRRLGYKFSVEETKALLEAARGLGLTINHVAHGAVFLVCTNDNFPPDDTPKDAVLMNYGLVNARHRLRAPYNNKNGYPGYCLGMSPMFVKLSLITENSDKSEKEQVTIVARELKERYRTQKEYPALLAIEPQQVDLMVAEMMAGPPPPPWMGPWYSGDGKGEDGLVPEYSSGGKKVITIADFFQSLNKTDPGPFFRTYSWGGRLELSADYNENAMPREVVQGFMDRWAELIRLIL